MRVARDGPDYWIGLGQIGHGMGQIGHGVGQIGLSWTDDREVGCSTDQ